MVLEGHCRPVRRPRLGVFVFLGAGTADLSHQKSEPAAQPQWLLTFFPYRRRLSALSQGFQPLGQEQIHEP